jgi:Domain of unknown function (DUF4365)
MEGDAVLLTRNHREEALCRAYVQAVAALAGLGTSVPTPDYGVDLSLRKIEQRGVRHLDGRLQLDLQLRSTTRANVRDSEVRYDLDVQTYEFLRELSPIRCLLVVLLLPDDETLWLTQTLEELLIRECAYWFSLRGMGLTTATSSVRIAIPRVQVFSVQAVQAILNRLGQGGEA